MLSEFGVSAVLEASITGAGLVLAVYALLTPLSRRIFTRRAKKLESKIKEFEETRKKVSPESTRETKKLQSLQEDIAEFKIMPAYFRMEFILVPFTSYLFSVILSFLYLENFYENIISDFIIGFFFFIANLTFLVVGFLAIIGVYSAMEEQFESIKEKQKETGLEKF